MSLKPLCQNDRTSEGLDECLWPLTTDAMTQALKKSLENAGLPSKRFGFHSFRSGFFTSVLAVSGAKGESVQDGLTKAALITGWTPLSAVEMNYIKQPARRNIIATNLIGVTQTPTHTHPPSFSQTSTASQNSSHLLPNSLDFHYLQSVTPLQNRKKRSYAFEVKHLLELQTHQTNKSD